ncbi:hypothetical protein CHINAEXTREME_19145 [Halobiforma lacisalsi AJ5]|uniref:GrpB family protein n=1 Tax=Natronobacterium lacisalsi AJ5 TaxID=358396 RepID=M0LUM8_NATLA|nr:GrpB family protein [Halobiforma lacisalsi]APW99754.1 hypothetical protein CHINAEXTREME_19145 [Halobiforma lacisalsi AJ5]EMA36069.1 hypothetical protein C445_04408 [Halobiforma lacisalsi AJ5]
MVDPNDDPIELVSSGHDAWRERFAAERDRVRETLHDAALESALERVEHVGSTAVPGLPAKDIVDLDVVVADDAVASVSRTLETELGGTRMENSDEWHPLFRRENGQRFNDHVFAASADGWRISVVTRDVLASRPDLREEYAALKRDLAGGTDDLTEYSVGKTAFVERVLEIARTDEALSFAFEVPTVE